MTKHGIAEYQNLIFSGQAFSFLSYPNMCSTARRKMFERLLFINKYGFTDARTNVFEKTSHAGLWEVKWKGNKTEWRFLAKRIQGTDTYAVVYGFQKKTKKISTHDINTAKQIAKNEGW